MEQIDNQTLLTTNQFCELLGISRVTAWRWTKANTHIPTLKVGNQRIYTTAHLQAFKVRRTNLPATSADTAGSVLSERAVQALEALACAQMVQAFKGFHSDGDPLVRFDLITGLQDAARGLLKNLGIKQTTPILPIEGARDQADTPQN